VVDVPANSDQGQVSEHGFLLSYNEQAAIVGVSIPSFKPTTATCIL